MKRKQKGLPPEIQALMRRVNAALDSFWRDRAARAPEQNALRAHVEAERRYVQDIQELHGKERGE